MSVFVRYADGKEYGAKNWKGLVDLINHSNIFGGSASAEDYMEDVKNLIYETYGEPMEFDGPLEFFQELQRLGRITEIKTYEQPETVENAQ